VNLALSALAMVAHFDAQDLVDEESLPDQKHVNWHSHEHFWQPPIVHKLLACSPLDDKTLDTSTVFEEVIVFVTAAVY